VVNKHILITIPTLITILQMRLVYSTSVELYSVESLSSEDDESLEEGSSFARLLLSIFSCLDGLHKTAVNENNMHTTC